MKCIIEKFLPIGMNNFLYRFADKWFITTNHKFAGFNVLSAVAFAPIAAKLDSQMAELNKIILQENNLIEQIANLYEFGLGS